MWSSRSWSCFGHAANGGVLLTGLLLHCLHLLPPWLSLVRVLFHLGPSPCHRLLCCCVLRRHVGMGKGGGGVGGPLLQRLCVSLGRPSGPHLVGHHGVVLVGVVCSRARWAARSPCNCGGGWTATSWLHCGTGWSVDGSDVPVSSAWCEAFSSFTFSSCSSGEFRNVTIWK